MDFAENITAEGENSNKYNIMAVGESAWQFCKIMFADHNG
jgi:hypothetical protein